MLHIYPRGTPTLEITCVYCSPEGAYVGTMPLFCVVVAAILLLTYRTVPVFPGNNQEFFTIPMKDQVTNHIQVSYILL